MFFLGYLFIIVKDLYSSTIILSLSFFFFLVVVHHWENDSYIYNLFIILDPHTNEIGKKSY